jgi:hypothetical protein
MPRRDQRLGCGLASSSRQRCQWHYLLLAEHAAADLPRPGHRGAYPAQLRSGSCGHPALRNQGNEALGQMAAQILLTAWSRLARQGRADATTPLPSVLTQFRRGGEQPLPNLGREIVVSDIGIDERPPLITVDLPRPVSRTAAR